jgi:hypothetical protein
MPGEIKKDFEDTAIACAEVECIGQATSRRYILSGESDFRSNMNG